MSTERMRTRSETLGDIDTSMDQTHPIPPPFNPILGGGNKPQAAAASPSKVVGSGTPASPLMQAPVSVPAPTSTINRTALSVVPDLMRVYESMTGGVQPRTTAGTEAMKGAVNTLPPSLQRPSQTEGYAIPWTTYEAATGISIPPIPDNPFTTPAATGTVAAIASSSTTIGAVAAPGGAKSTTPVAESASSSMASAATSGAGRTSGGRTLRKRHSSSFSKLSQDGNDDDDDDESDSMKESSSKRNSKARRKNKETDGRWSKRFTWPEPLHRDFVSAIFDVGLKHSSPSTILEHMPKHEQINSERVKSHLQKYRLHRAKSKKEFMASYESTVEKMKKDGPPSKTSSLSGRELAAHLTYSTLMGTNAKDDDEEEEDYPQPEAATKSNDTVTPAADTTSTQAQSESQDSLVFPRLTEEEKRSPIGAAMGYLMGLFFTLKQQLQVQREAAAAAEAANVAVVQQHQLSNNVAVGDVYNSFVHGYYPTENKAEGAQQTGPSTRVNLEENSLMKREMQFQMAFQNKMRALKQQEVEKYKGEAISQRRDEHGNESAVQIGAQYGGELKHDPEEAQQQQQQHSESSPGEGEQQPNSQIEYQQQGPGESDGNRQRGMSLSADDFWNTDVVDDQLFEFLMSN